MKKLLTLAGIASLVGAGFLFSSANAEPVCSADAVEAGVPDLSIGSGCLTVNDDGSASGYLDGADENPAQSSGYVTGSASADGTVEICADEAGSPFDEDADPSCNADLVNEIPAP